MKNDVVLVRYHEIALKGDNRGWFEKTLARNIKKLLLRSAPDLPCEVEVMHGRMLVHTPWNQQTLETLKKVFGIASFSPMIGVPTDMPTIVAACLTEIRAHIAQNGVPSSFCVRSRRSDKVFPETSVELDRIIGAEILKTYPDWKVQLKNPALTVGLEFRTKESFLWTQKIEAHGGLPVGSNGPLLTLISGGIDSPVAATQVLRRGSPTSFVHFFGTPFVGEEVLDKIEDLVEAVNRYQPVPKPLYVIPFGKIQEKIALVTDAKMRTLLYRRMMIRIADALAVQIGAKGLITGESLGQVASQTIENMATINSVAKLPILRPLVTCTKDEIITQSKKWGFFDISIRPGLDCCTLFADRHPILRSDPIKVLEQEAAFSVDDLVQEALSAGYVKHRRT